MTEPTPFDPADRARQAFLRTNPFAAAVQDLVDRQVLSEWPELARTQAILALAFETWKRNQRD